MEATMRDRVQEFATNLVQESVHHQDCLQVNRLDEHHPIQGSASHLHWIQSLQDEGGYQAHNRWMQSKRDGEEGRKRASPTTTGFGWISPRS